MVLLPEPLVPAKTMISGCLLCFIYKISCDRFDLSKLTVPFFYQEPIFHIVAWKSKCTCFLVVELYGIGCQERFAFIWILWYFDFIDFHMKAPFSICFDFS